MCSGESPDVDAEGRHSDTKKETKVSPKDALSRLIKSFISPSRQSMQTIRKKKQALIADWVYKPNPLLWVRCIFCFESTAYVRKSLWVHLGITVKLNNDKSVAFFVLSRLHTLFKTLWGHLGITVKLNNNNTSLHYFLSVCSVIINVFH